MAIFRVVQAFNPNRTIEFSSGQKPSACKNRNSAKAAEPSKAAEPADEADNLFNDAAGEGTDMDVPF